MKRMMGMVAIVALLSGAASATVYQDFESGLGFGNSREDLVTISQSTDAAFSGLNSMKLVSNGFSGSWVELYDWDGISWGDGPYLAVRVKAAAANTGGTSLYWRFWDWNRNGGDWANGGSAVDGLTLPNDTAWHTYYLDASAFDRSNSGGMCFYTNGMQTGTFYIDKIEVVPEPITLTMLAMGGVAMLRRRMA